MIGCRKCHTTLPSQWQAHTSVSKAGTLRCVPLLYLVLTSTLLVVNEALDAAAMAQEFHSSAHPPTPPFTTKMTRFIVTRGAGV